MTPSSEVDLEGIAKQVMEPIKDDTINLLNEQGVMHGEKEH